MDNLGLTVKELHTEVLIIGGGTAGCYAAINLSEATSLEVLIAEKAHIKRSGCLAAGVNALNCYITKGQTPEDYVAYATKDAEQIVRGDLLLSMCQRVNKVTARLEELGLVILKNEQGEYVARGKRNIKINGENIKTILAEAVAKSPRVKVLNHINITDYLVYNHQIYGAIGFNIDTQEVVVIRADYVLCATGGAAGLYKPNNPGFSKHKMWYSPFNTGAGYAMGILAGAEMTTLEMRFVALRCKDTIAPTGTIAQGVGAKQINGKGENYEVNYGITTSQRIYGTVEETLKGRGPCYLGTVGITETQGTDLLKAYLNMAPSQTLKWVDTGKLPQRENVEIAGTEPYVVGGHTASGYWIDEKRLTTIKNLWAAGDVAGGCPQKYVTGALAEGEIAAIAIAKQAKMTKQHKQVVDEAVEAKVRRFIQQKIAEYESYLQPKEAATLYGVDEVEAAMQKVMDEYAGGIGSNYCYSEEQLRLALEKLEDLTGLLKDLRAADAQELMYIYELRERLIICRVLVEHLRARKETRWHIFNEYLDYPGKSDTWLKYVNSRMDGQGEIKIVLRDLIKVGEVYEHSN